MADLQLEADDATLVRAVQEGDPDAFAVLFRRHYGTVRRACAHRMSSQSEAEEVAQAAFVRAFERIDQCTGDRRFGAWVQVMAFRLCADTWRAQARTAPTEHLAEGRGAAGPNDCEEAALRRERAAEINQALDALPPRQREVIIARDLEGRRPTEIAAALAVSVGAVDSLLMRARRRMAVAYRATAEQGAVSGSVNTASLAATSAAANARPLGRMIDSVSAGLSTAASNVAAALGLGPGAPGMGQRLAGLVTAGALLVAPAALGGQDPQGGQPPAAGVGSSLPSPPEASAVGLPAPPASAPSVQDPALPPATLPGPPPRDPRPEVHGPGLPLAAPAPAPAQLPLPSTGPAVAAQDLITPLLMPVTVPAAQPAPLGTVAAAVPGALLAPVGEVTTNLIDGGGTARR